LSTTEYLYTKDQIDNKFYTQSYINTNFLKNSENIYIDGLGEFKETEEDISLQEVLKKINIQIKALEDRMTELKAMIQGGATTPPKAVLDDAILDQVILS
jgi:hypothetical protein